MAMSSSLTLYDLLGIASDTSIDDLRTTYKQLILKYHPDKRLHTTNNIDNSDKFIEIDRAYRLLVDSERRAAYDIWLRQQSYVREKCLIFDTVKLTELTKIVEEEGEVVEVSYLYDCRCGGQYCVGGSELELSIDRVFLHCDTCSLNLEVTI